MKLDPKKTAVLTLDIQQGILDRIKGHEVALENAAHVVSEARRKQYTLIHVGLGFEAGFPEISPKNSRFSSLKEQGLFLKGSASARFHSSIFESNDLVVYKHRVSAFSGNALQTILRSKGVEVLVLFGFATSGIVLSTLRQASDLDFECIVIKDACLDRDEEVHQILTEKVFAAQSIVMTSQEFQQLK